MKTPKVDVKKALTGALANGGGALAAAKVNSFPIGKNADGSKKTVGHIKPLFRGIGKLVIGALAPGLVKDKKTKALVEGAAAGWNAIATVEVVNSFIKDDTKKIAISGPGDLDSNILGIGTDAAYILDGGSADDVAGVDSDNVI